MNDLNAMMQNMNTQMADPKVFQEKKEGFKRDERFYKISKDSDKNGSVLVRFLPSLNSTKDKLNTFISRKIHNVTRYDANANKRFILEVCPNSVGGKDCPICTEAWRGYNEEKDAGRAKGDVAKDFLKLTAKDKYITNMIIIDDKEKPENNGKIFLFEYGPQLHELIQKEMQPTKEEQEEKRLVPFNAWDVFSGKNFRLKLQDGRFTLNGFPSWKESFFSTEPNAHCKDNDEFVKLLESVHCLDEFTGEEAIVPTEKLQKSLDYVLFKNKATTESKDETKAKEQSLSKPQEMEVPKSEPAPVKEEPKEVVKEEPVVDTQSTDDFFSQFN